MSARSGPGARRVAAVDLGATSGRVMVGLVGADTLQLTEAHRFENRPVQVGEALHWDVLALYQGVLDGLRAAGPVDSVGVDSWAVDYGLVDADGVLLGNPRHYRDPRTTPEVVEGVWKRIGGAEALYQATGLQHLPFNTVFQLAAARGSAQLAAARAVLLIPDLIGHWLSGTVGAESTNASTTGLFDATTRSWSPAAVEAAGIASSLLPPLREPGTFAGPLLPRVTEHTGLAADTRLAIVASHDTASAVAAVPATGPEFAYISCGTWSLAGIELTTPVLTEASRQAGFTNELGVDGTIRYLRNVMGLWLLNESRRVWQDHGIPADLETLLAQAAAAEPFACLIDPNDPRFLPPGDIPDRIRRFCADTGQPPPPTPGATVRCILESLALAHRHTLRQAATLAHRSLGTVHLVGGGSHNALLCQWTADALGLPVIAGPAEATAVGNVLMQGRAHGLLADLAAMRHLVAASHRLCRYEPSGDEAAWDHAAERVGLG
ncbi:rhamnulokinase family protein [Catenulispora subtropica]|uniref:Rhamnulokinase family protein n=1 Tax=Catenulispora subtropica TaxID=450798 RepID=A0ABN2SBZ3_9ACTN